MAYNREANIGKVFGEVTILSFVRSAKGSSVYLGRCSCGNTKEFYIGNLRSGKSKSCGCVAIRLTAKRSRTHGERQTRLYRTWTNMKTRCYNDGTPNFDTYGGKGIEMCEDWRDSYTAFRDWALLNGYSENLTIDRIDNSGNYEPCNCRWATVTQQVRNRDYTWNITIDGETKTAKEWCELYAVL